jgi:hypothetical protein
VWMCESVCGGEARRRDVCARATLVPSIEAGRGGCGSVWGCVLIRLSFVQIPSFIPTAPSHTTSSPCSQSIHVPCHSPPQTPTLQTTVFFHCTRTSNITLPLFTMPPSPLLQATSIPVGSKKDAVR